MGWTDWLRPRPSIERFALDLARDAARRGASGWSYDAQECALVHTEGLRFFVRNSWLEYCSAQRADRERLIQKYLSLMVEPPPEVPQLWGLAAKNLTCSLRSRHQLVATEIESRGGPAPFVKPVSMPWLADLEIVLTYDFGAYVAQVLPETAAAWGQSTEALFARAKANLAALERPSWQPAQDGVFELSSEAGYQESFVLVDKVWDALPVEGEPVVAIPNRGVLAVAGSQSPKGLARLVANAHRSMQENPWPMSAVLFRRVGGTWEPFTPGPALAPAARVLELISRAATYEEQQQALEKLFERTGDDVYVAKYDLMHARDGSGVLQSWCSWSEGVPSLLPRTDVVILGRTGESAQPVIVPWADVERLCARYMQSTNEDPPRFRVDSFPADEWALLVKAGEKLE